MRRKDELGKFLKARRASITPESVGLPRGARRRTAGLRREEVATLAGIGLSWYTWLEQGKPIHPSAELLRRLAATLRLDRAGEAYLFTAVGVPQAKKQSASGFRAPPVDLPPAISALMRLHPAPVFIIDPLGDLIASNALADRLFDFRAPDEAGMDAMGRFTNNSVWEIFMNPRRRAIYVDFDRDVRAIVAVIRVMAATQEDSPRYRDLITSLYAASAEFRRLWDDRETALPTPHALRLQHPEFGEITVHSVRFPLDIGCGAVVVMVVPADEATRIAFARLA